MAKTLNRVGEFFGWFLGHLPILLITILIYVFISFCTYLLLYCNIEKNQNPFLITYIVATGGDPAPYLPVLEKYLLLYYWILVFHVISWLFVPVIIALAADATYRLHEEKKTIALRRLKRKMVDLMHREKPELSSEQIEYFVNQTIDSWQNVVDEKE